MFKVIFDSKQIGESDSITEARKMIKARSGFRIQKFVTDSWDEDSNIVSGCERGGPERCFDIIRIGSKFDS